MGGGGGGGAFGEPVIQNNIWLIANTRNYQFNASVATELLSFKDQKYFNLSLKINLDQCDLALLVIFLFS